VKFVTTARDKVPVRPKPRVQSAARTVAILLAISQSSHGLKAKEISERLQVPRQVAYHLIHTLQSTGIIRKDAQNRYVLGLAAALVADGFRRHLAPAEHLGPRVRSIVQATGETAYATGWIDGEIVAMVTARGQSPIQAAEVETGHSGDAHARASGKLLLALSDPAVRDKYLASHRLGRRTKKTITARKELLQELDRIRTRGYAVDEEEFSEGLCCLAVPIEGLGDSFVLGISVPAPRFRTNRTRYLAALQKAAKLEEFVG
jgi:IclR family acetate operon transcriptional repressor